MPSLALSLDASACTVASRQSIYLHLHRTPQLALQLKSKNKQNLWHEQQQTCDKQYLWLPVQSTDYGLNLSNNARLIAIKTNKCLSASDTLTQVFFLFSVQPIFALSFSSNYNWVKWNDAKWLHNSVFISKVIGAHNQCWTIVWHLRPSLYSSLHVSQKNVYTGHLIRNVYVLCFPLSSLLFFYSWTHLDSTPHLSGQQLFFTSHLDSSAIRSLSPSVLFTLPLHTVGNARMKTHTQFLCAHLVWCSACELKTWLLWEASQKAVLWACCRWMWG